MQYDAFEAWLCHARPAHQGGRVCGHLNTTPTLHQGHIVCAACGCTKIASDHRKAEGEAKTRRPA